jgi:hypothetical protein
VFVIFSQGDTLKGKGLIYLSIGVAKEWALMWKGCASSCRHDEDASWDKGARRCCKGGNFVRRVSGISKCFGNLNLSVGYILIVFGFVLCAE